MKPKTLCVLLLVASTSLSAFADTALRNASQPEYARLEKFRDAGSVIAGARCAKPAYVEDKAIRNQHDPDVTDYIRTYGCPGLEISIYRASFTKPVTEIAGAVTFSDPNRTLPYGVRIGMAGEALIRLFGRPDRTRDDGIDYYADMGPGADVVSFELQDGRLARVVWSFFID